jgi:hypothetical protein
LANSLQDAISRKTHHLKKKKGWWNGSRSALSSNSSTTKKKEEEKKKGHTLGHPALQHGDHRGQGSWLPYFPLSPLLRKAVGRFVNLNDIHEV